ncbi:MAG: ABC transporter permease [Anaerolineae bacterium]
MQEMAREEALPLAEIEVRERLVEEQSYWGAVWHRLRQDKITMGAAITLVLICVLALTASLIGNHILHHDPTDVNLDEKLEGPSSRHWLGTDEVGRDVLTRAIYAGRVSLSMGFAVALISMTMGVSLGLISGFHGGRLIDDVINAIIQTLKNIPTLFLLIMLSMLFTPKPWLLALFIGVTGWMGTSRLVRGQVFSIRERDYVMAARAVGASNWRIIFRHILPNVSSMIIVIATFDVAGAILVESGLSYLGVGIQPPTASWGNMLRGSIETVKRAPWLATTPGVFIFLTTLSIFLLGDGLRDALDPWLRE